MLFFPHSIHLSIYFFPFLLFIYLFPLSLYIIYVFTSFLRFIHMYIIIFLFSYWEGEKVHASYLGEIKKIFFEHV